MTTNAPHIPNYPRGLSLHAPPSIGWFDRVANWINGRYKLTDVVPYTFSGTSLDVTGLPRGIKRAALLFNAVSTTGVSLPLIRLGDSSGLITSGYSGACNTVTAVSTGAINFSVGFAINGSLAGNVYHGIVLFYLQEATTFTWCVSGIVGLSNTTATMSLGGSVALTDELDRIRLTTVGGTDTFDNGNISVSYEY